VVFSLGGFINALFAKNFDHISWFPTLCWRRSPISARIHSINYASQLGPRLQRTPTHPVHVSAFRYGFLGTTDVDLGLAYGIMIGACPEYVALAAIVATHVNRICRLPGSKRVQPPANRR